MEEQEEITRRYYFINPVFQLKFIGFTIVMTMLAIAVVYASQLYFFWNFAKLGKEVQLSEGHPFFLFLSQQHRLMDRVFLVTALGIALVTIVWGIFLSHKVAGPIRRIDAHIKRALETKDYSPLKFRKTDFFPELAEHVNSLLAELRKKND